jgi:uncharacterized Zn-binding protein involved in type VI secretion
MPAVARLGDSCTGHGCFPPRGNDSASPNVFANNIAVHRQNDHWPVHRCGRRSHDSHLAGGSATVFANGQELGRIGDTVACGSAVAAGSPNVFAGDGAKITNLPKQFSLANSSAVRTEAGRFAPLDDPDSIGLTPSAYPSDGSAPAATSGNTVNVATTSTDTPVMGPCTSFEKPDYNYQISKSFTLGNYSVSALFSHEIQAQAGLSVSDIICNLQALSINVIEPLNDQYPGLRINSGFRTVTNGTSQHEKGMACDVQWPGISASEYQARGEWIARNLPYDQMIFEHGNSVWIHLSFNRTAAKQRQQILTMYQGKYTPGITNYYA